MNLVIFIAVVALGAYAFLRHSREARRRWLESLHLQGSWDWHSGASAASLDIAGGPGEGTYVETTATSRQRGQWALHGQRITFSPDQGAAFECEFRVFADGSIGLDGVGRERRVYTRRASNVVPLRSRR
jgi:hypothetical protein